MGLMQQIIDRAKADKQRIVLPEGTEERTLTAADRAIADGLADIILIGDPDIIYRQAEAVGLKHIAGATVVNPTKHPKRAAYAYLLHDLRKAKGMTQDEAFRLVQNPLYLGCLIIKAGDADGEIAGALNTTGNVLRPALQIIKTQQGVTCASGAFLMIVPDATYGEDGVMLFADCAVIPDPSIEELAGIALSTASTAKALTGVEPRIAMLSYSTKGSGTTNDKMADAVLRAKELSPNLLIDGELQADAALVPMVAVRKAPDSPVAGRANVLVFPNLAAANIAYKLVERLAHAQAIGPILQGMAAPVNDLSRGCSADDIYKMIAITANQARIAKG
ncbi:MAG: phosphate acetyltransferase [Tannerellaceae bacterium]|jgi:phosphate acetyltransferase|nr:phosphate acetyltransferase [Tannerellaceae bacterium]